jgi:hypothetical protein
MLDRNSTWGEEAYTDEQFQKMATKFVSKGVPVIIGEWGVMRRFGLPDLTGTELKRHLASRTYFSKYVTDKANALGLKPMWWDAGGLGSGTMWLFDRSTAAIIDADTINALTGGPALPPPDATTPNAPSALTATVASTSQVDLTWTDSASNEDGFELDRATNSTFTTNLVTTTLAANTTSRSVTGLSAATTYYFRVRAKNSSGASSYTSTASATTQATPPPAPPPSSSGGGGGGGGAPSAWFLGTLALATLLRRTRT